MKIKSLTFGSMLEVSSRKKINKDMSVNIVAFGVPIKIVRKLIDEMFNEN